MKKQVILFSIIFLIISACDNEPINKNNNIPKKPIKTVSLKTHFDTVNYALGIVIAKQMDKYGIENVNYGILSKAIEDYINNSNKNVLPIHPDVAKRIVNLYVKKTTSKKTITLNELNNNFLKENITKQGIQVLKSGIQYKVVTQGQGLKPNLDDKVTIHFAGQLIDGTIISNTYSKSPVEFKVKNSILGWQKVLTQMNEGSEWIIYLPPEFAYGQTGSKKVPPNSVVIYKIQLIRVKK